MQFTWQRLTFRFAAKEPVRFPRLVPANILRGALGVLSRKLACPEACPGANTCEAGATCLYSRIFEPAPTGPMPSGLADIPRPFVFRARHLDGRIIEPGEHFGFDLHLFLDDPAITQHLRDTFASLETHGLGPSRGRVRLAEMTTERCSISLAPKPEKTNPIRIAFLSPTELKSGGHLADEPHFPPLFNRIRDRVATLRAIYGQGPLDLDFSALGDRARNIRMTACAIHPCGTSRFSTRTGQTHALGGFTGEATYEGDLTEFRPWLEAAQITGVGRQAVWGKGEILVIDI